MIQVAIGLVLTLFLVALVFNIPQGLNYLKSATPRQKVLILAWAAMFLGQAQIFSHTSAIRGDEALDTGRLYQLMWMFFSALLVLQLILTAKILAGIWRFPLIALFVFCFFAIASAAFSPAKAFTVYKAGQVLMDALLVVVASSESVRYRAPAFIANVTMVLVSLLLFSVTACALIVPQLAFVANEGAIGKSLHGVIPTIHQNELGLMAAIGLIVGTIRAFSEGGNKRAKFYWIAVALMAGLVLFLAQARTSLAGAAIALLMLGLLIRRLRWLSGGIVFAGVCLGIYFMLGGTLPGAEKTVELYVTRGNSAEQLSTLSGRTILWGIGWEMFTDSPYFGHGYAAGVRMDGPKYGLASGTNMHSAHMQVLVDMGAFGYLAWISFVLGVAYIVYRNFSQTGRRSSDYDYTVEAGLVVFLIIFRSFLGHVLVTHQFNMMIYLSVYIYAMSSIILRSTSLIQKDSTEENRRPLLFGRKVPNRILARGRLR
jgi:O-antigen ligase